MVRFGRSPAPFLAVGIVGAIVLTFAQLYYFTKLALYAEQLPTLAKVLTITLGTSFLFFCWIGALRFTLMMVFAYLGWTQTVRSRPECTYWPKVSILVPAFNEGEQIAATLGSLLSLDYPDLDIVMVDDGSDDDTFEVASGFAGQAQTTRLRVLRKPNGGKSSALNLAFHESTGDLVMCVDADSRLEESCVRHLVRAFLNPTVGAVAGQVQVSNRGSLLTKLQALEYGLMNGLPRLAQSNFAYVLIAPGPVAMFRRKVLAEVWQRWGRFAEPLRSGHGWVSGPWENDTFAEDCDLTLNVILAGKKVIFEPRAISHTDAPTWLFALLNQRYRWIRGNVQAIRKAWGRWRELEETRIALPLWLGVFLLESVVWPVVNIYGLVLFGILLIVVGQVGVVLPWYFFLLAIEVASAGFSIRAMGEQPALILLSPIFRSVYSVLLDINTMFSVADEMLRERMTWG